MSPPCCSSLPPPLSSHYLPSHPLLANLSSSWDSLSRFLRARRFDPHKASKQFADAEAWRAKHNVEALYATFPVDEFENTRRFYPRWTGRRDKVYLNLDLGFILLGTAG